MSTSPNILITGATGFIGRYLLEQLKSGNAGTIVCLDRKSFRIFQNGKLLERKEQFNTFHLSELLSKIKIDVVYHLATKYITDHKEDQIMELVLDNVYFTAKVCELLTEHQPVFINACSYWQFDTKTEKLVPNNLYAATKNASLSILDHYKITHNFRIINAVLGDTYGMKDLRPKLLYKLIEASLNGENILLGDPNHVLALTHVSDVVAGLRKLIEQQNLKHSTLEYVNLISQHEYTISDLINLIEDKTRRNIAHEWIGNKQRIAKNLKPWRCGTKLEGWSADISLEEAIDDLIQQYSDM